MKIFVNSTNFMYLMMFYWAFSIELNAQVPEIEWQKCYGGTNIEEAWSIQQTIDTGFIIVGKTKSTDGDVTDFIGGIADFWVLKIDSSGNIEWQKCLGGTGWDQAYSVQQTSDGGYIIAGFTQSNDGDITFNHGADDYWVVKLNSLGEIEWQQSYGGSNVEYPYSIIQTFDGGYIFTGFTRSNDGDVSGLHGTLNDVWVVKINSGGVIEWQNVFGGSGIDEGRWVFQKPDGSYLIAATSGSNDGDVSGNHGEDDFWVFELNSDGELIWEKSYGGSNYERLFSGSFTSEGNLILAGYTKSNDGNVTGFHGGNEDSWVISIDSEGEINWQRCLGGSSSDQAHAVNQYYDNGFIFSGYSSSIDGDLTINNGHADYWTVKTDSIGNIDWQISSGGSTNDEALCASNTYDGGSISAGWTISNNGDVSGFHGVRDIWVVKLAPPCIPISFYADNDEDGFGDLLNDSMTCNLPLGYVSDSTDCNDDNELIFPTAFDICNAIDDNCNGLIDEDAVFTTWYLDFDSDGFGDLLNDSLSCFDITGYVNVNSDCNDLNAEINPFETEICNDIDDNCNFDIDEGLTFYTFFIDADSDNFGNSDVFINSCLAIIAGYVFDSTDCDDDNYLIYPGAIEICDYFDNDCNGIIDDNLSYIHSFEDADSDNYGNIEVDSLSCEIPDGFVVDNSDCDDTNPLIYPGADEILNGIDDDCNELIDEGLSIEETDLNAIIIYPNPTDNILYIQWPDSEQGTFQLINVSGEIIESFNKIYPVNIIDVSQYAAGVYFLKIISLNIQTEIKFIKE